MFGLSGFEMIECDVCKSGRSILPNEIKLLISDKNNLNATVKCSCGNEFTYKEGIINSEISENEFSSYDFISDIHDSGHCEITVGQSCTIKFNREIPVVNKIYVTCIGGFADTYAIQKSNKDFIIISSEVPEGVPAGNKLRMNWLVYGRSGWDNVPVWQRYLVQAKEEIISKKYNVGLLTCEMAFESFIDLTLNNHLIAKGIPIEAAYTIVESMSNIYDKVHKLLFNLCGIKFKEYKEINKRWQLLVERRNKIAHGEVAEISEIEAREAFDTVVRGIFYIIL